jgi:gluconolactonase
LVYFKWPNGLAFSPDEKILYVSDAEASEVQAYDVGKDNVLGNGRVFCKPPRPDGMRVDEQGNVWIACADGVNVHRTDGTRAALVPTPEAASNVAFGGPDKKTLFITAVSGLYKVQCAVSGRR